MCLPVMANHLYQFVNLSGRYLALPVGSIYKNVAGLLNRYVAHIIAVVNSVSVTACLPAVVTIVAVGISAVNVIHITKQAVAIRVHLYLWYYPVGHSCTHSCKYCFHW